jgi:hypothetical protein
MLLRLMRPWSKEVKKAKQSLLEAQEAPHDLGTLEAGWASLRESMTNLQDGYEATKKAQKAAEESIAKA